MPSQDRRIRDGLRAAVTNWRRLRRLASHVRWAAATWWMLAMIRPASPRPRHPSEPGFAPDSATDEQVRWLVNTYGRVVFRVAYAVTRSDALAEEVVQDTMVKAWTSMPSWEGDRPVKWLRVVARNQAISVMRKESRSAAHDDWERAASSAAGTERVVEARTILESMRDALATLDEESRTMIVLRETDDLSYDEIAALFETTPPAVKAKLYRARHTLKGLMREWDL